MAGLVELRSLHGLVNADLVARIQKMLIVAELLAGIDADTEDELVSDIAWILDEHVDSAHALASVLGSPAAGLVELVDRSVFRLVARRAVRIFRRRWGRLSASDRSAILAELHDINTGG